MWSACNCFRSEHWTRHCNAGLGIYVPNWSCGSARGTSKMVRPSQGGTADDGSGGADSSRALHVGQLSEFGDGSGIEVAVSVAGVQGSQRDQTDTSGPANTILLRKNK